MLPEAIRAAARGRKARDLVENHQVPSSSVELVARAIFEAIRREVDDDEWRRLWEFHTSPEAAQGGEWDIVRAANAAILMVEFANERA